MGVMTARVINYTVNPIWAVIKRFGKSTYRFMEMAQYARAARVLAQLGYLDLADNALAEYKKLKSSK